MMRIILVLITLCLVSSCGKESAPGADVPPMTSQTYCMCDMPNGQVEPIGTANCMVNGLTGECSCVIDSGTRDQQNLSGKLGVVTTP